MAVNTDLALSFKNMQTAMNNYYGGDDAWNIIYGDSKAQTAKDFADWLALNSMAGVQWETLKAVDGTILGRNLVTKSSNILKSAITNIGANSNSNLTPALQGAGAATTIKVPMNLTADVEGAITAVKSGVRAFSSGVETALGTVISGTVLPATVAVGTGVALGAVIGSKLYDADPDFWAGMSEVAVDKWNSITSYAEDLKSNVFNTLLGTKTLEDGTNESTTYISEDALVLSALYMQSKSLFDSRSGILTSDYVGSKGNTIPKGFSYKNTTFSIKQLRSREGGAYSDYYVDGKIGVWDNNDCYLWKIKKNESTFTYKVCTIKITGTALYANLIVRPYNSISIGGAWVQIRDTDIWGTNTTSNAETTTINNIKYAFKSHNFNSDEFTPNSVDLEINKLDANVISDIIEAMYYGVYEDVYTGGITKQEGATIPDLTGITTWGDMLAKLKELYPELWENRVENDVVQEDGTVKTIIYVGCPWLTGTEGAVATTEGAVAGADTISEKLDGIADTNARIATILQTYIKTIEHEGGVVDTATPEPIPNPPIEGTGTTPIITVPVGSSHALWSIYNPTLEQINSLGGYLWSNNFIDQLLKMFNNPMEAVISLHKIFGTPPTNGTAEIKIGYLSTGVTDVNVVSNQYFTVDCGSVDLPEYFGNVLDYNGFTDISLYLPFIGIINIDNADVMRATISIKYQIDVFTGACLAQVNVQRDAKGGILYQYTGNCAVQYPLSSGSYIGIITGTLTGAAFGALGGKGIGAAVGALGGLVNSHNEYQRSGNFSGNAGAMGIKKPYLIISRPQTQIADNAQTLIGYPTNTYTLLSNCIGFTKVLECHVDSIGNASDEEKRQIETALKQGIIVK